MGPDALLMVDGGWAEAAKQNWWKGSVVDRVGDIMLGHITTRLKAFYS